MEDPGPSGIERPQQAHQRDDANEREDSLEIERDPELEATELENYHSATVSQPTAGQDAPGSENHDPPATNIIGPRMRRLRTPRSHKDDAWIRKFWRRQVRVAVPHEDCRDHLACERTFLGYMRTSLALSMLGVTVAQLFRLEQNPTPVHSIGFYEAGKPVAALFIGSAILVSLLGAYRFWRLQNAIVRRKIRAAGWELHAVTFIVGGLMLIVFAIVVRVDP